MNNNSTGLRELSIKRFKSMLETDFKNGDITDGIITVSVVYLYH